MAKNPFGKTRKQDNPYAVYRGNGGFVWKVLKTYKLPTNEEKDEYARWFVAATSDMMHNGSYEMGDTYAIDIKRYGRLDREASDPAWVEAYGSEGGPQ